MLIFPLIYPFPYLTLIKFFSVITTRSCSKTPNSVVTCASCSANDSFSFDSTSRNSAYDRKVVRQADRKRANRICERGRLRR